MAPLSLNRQSGHHLHSGASVAAKMRWVLIALAPGVAALTVCFGWGTLMNILACTFLCLGFEASCLYLRRQSLRALQDYSALVTACLLAVSLPPYSPWWLLAGAAFTAIVIAKQLFGGLGFNLFNPAMAAYVLMLISFPIPMSQWPTPHNLLSAGQTHMGPLKTLAELFNPGAGGFDGWTSATGLDLLKHQQGQTLLDFVQHQPLFKQAMFATSGWEWVNLGFFAGGLLLVFKKIISWHAPVAMLATVTVLAAWGYDAGSSHSTGSPLFHWLTGATMLGAFFIITDPVSGPASLRGKLLFGAGIGFLLFMIRVFGHYADGVAFAVICMNLFVPLIDRYTVPRAFGQHKAKGK